MICSSRARNRSADPDVSCFFGRIASTDAPTESRLPIRGNRQSEIASFRGLNAQGFRGSLRVVGEWATRCRRAELVATGSIQRIPSARVIARLMTTGRDTLAKAETVAIKNGLPALVQARELIATFHAMIRRKAEPELSQWIARGRESLIASFANGVVKDETAVRAAIASPWSNGQTEGQITKLKLVKRQMYGRAKIDLLQARLIGAT
jgi:transposase